MGVQNTKRIVFFLLAPLVVGCAKKYSAPDAEWNFSQDEAASTLFDPAATETIEGAIPADFSGMVEWTERSILMGRGRGATTPDLSITGPQGGAPVTLYNSTNCYPSALETKINAPRDSSLVAVATSTTPKSWGKLESKSTAPFSAESGSSKLFTFAGKSANRFLVYLVGLDSQKRASRSNSISVQVRNCAPGATLEITPPVVYDGAGCEPHETNFYVKDGMPGAPFISILTSPGGEKSQGTRELSANGTAESTAYSTVGLPTGVYKMEVWVSDLAGGYRSTNTASFHVKKCSK